MLLYHVERKIFFSVAFDVELLIMAFEITNYASCCSLYPSYYGADVAYFCSINEYILQLILLDKQVINSGVTTQLV